MAKNELVEFFRHVANMSSSDPISMTKEERNKATPNWDDYSLAKIKRAYDKVYKEKKGQKARDLLEFTVDAIAYGKTYEETGELWEKIGTKTKESILVRIDIGELRYLPQYRILNMKKSDLENKPGALPMWIQAVNSIPDGDMIIIFCDDEMTKKYGFPFDVMLHSSRPNND